MCGCVCVWGGGGGTADADADRQTYRYICDVQSLSLSLRTLTNAYLVNGISMKPTTGTRCPTLFDKKDIIMVP